MSERLSLLVTKTVRGLTELPGAVPFFSGAVEHGEWRDLTGPCEPNARLKRAESEDGQSRQSTLPRDLEMLPLLTSPHVVESLDRQNKEEFESPCGTGERCVRPEQVLASESTMAVMRSSVGS